MSTRKRKRITDGVPVQVWFEPPVFKRVQTIAEKDQRTLPTTIRLLVEEALVAREFEPKKENCA